MISVEKFTDLYTRIPRVIGEKLGIRVWLVKGVEVSRKQLHSNELKKLQKKTKNE